MKCTHYNGTLAAYRGGGVLGRGVVQARGGMLEDDRKRCHRKEGWGFGARRLQGGEGHPRRRGKGLAVLATWGCGPSSGRLAPGSSIGVDEDV